MMLAYRSANAKQFLRMCGSAIVQKLLNFEQKQLRKDIALEMLTTFNDDSDLLKLIITGDESWINGYDIETKV